MSAIRTAALLLLICLSACRATETVPETGRKRPKLQYTEAEMEHLGEESYREVNARYEVIRGGPDADMVRSVGQRLAAVTGKDYPWEFELLKADDTVNAFCLPGGKVAVFSGILPICAGEEGMAVVLSHEIAHAVLQHGNERMSQPKGKQLISRPMGRVTNLWGALAPGSRKLVMDGLGLGALWGRALPWDQGQESEADEVGLRYMQAAGFDIDQAPLFWGRMVADSPPGQISDSVSTHPASKERAEDMQRAIQELKAQATDGRATTRQ